MQATLVDQGLNLMMYGMGTVFVFLTVLVLATTLMSALLQRLPGQDSNSVNRDQANMSGTASAETLEAIRQAIALHRRR